MQINSSQFKDEVQRTCSVVGRAEFTVDSYGELMAGTDYKFNVISFAGV